MKTQAVIYGASRQGVVVLSVLRAAGILVIGFVDDSTQLQGGEVSGLPVFKGMKWIQSHLPADSGVVVAIGANEARMRIADKIRSLGVETINAIHPSAVVMDTVRLGTDIFIGPGAVLVCGSDIRDDVVVNTGASLDHDSLIERGAYLSPGVCTAGCVTIRRGAFVGTGAVISPGVVIGEGSVIGAGSLVLSDVPSGMLAYGHPAKSVKPVPVPADWRSILTGKSKGNS
jgi:sugar O-acyltransferase (sialic acid O-acetyltransferase NeuD family)